MGSLISNPATPNYILAIIIAVVMGVGYFRWARVQGASATILLQNQQMAARDRKIAEQDAQIRVLQATLAEQSERLKLLTDLVQGVPAWEKLHAGIASLEKNAARLDMLVEALPVNWISNIAAHQLLTQKIAAAVKADG